jgi:hypothetical protein
VIAQPVVHLLLLEWIDNPSLNPRSYARGFFFFGFVKSLTGIVWIFAGNFYVWRLIFKVGGVL